MPTLVRSRFFAVIASISRADRFPGPIREHLFGIALFAAINIGHLHFLSGLCIIRAMHEIDHDPHERPGRRYSLGKWWWGIWAMIVLFWIGQFAFDGFDWVQISLGFVTGGILSMWAVDMSSDG
jgi:hypothetical protein